jgi:hypothetical protein
VSARDRFIGRRPVIALRRDRAYSKGDQIAVGERSYRITRIGKTEHENLYALSLRDTADRRELVMLAER